MLVGAEEEGVDRGALVAAWAVLTGNKGDNGSLLLKLMLTASVANTCDVTGVEMLVCVLPLTSCLLSLATLAGGCRWSESLLCRLRAPLLALLAA